MKLKYIFFTLSFLLSFSCTSEHNIEYPEEVSTIIGEWQMIEYAYSPGGPDIYRSPSEENIKLIFNSNGVVNSQKFFQCSDGNFNIEQDTLSITFNCPEELDSRAYSISWEDEKLILIPTSPMCIEYCAYIFSRTS